MKLFAVRGMVVSLALALVAVNGWTVLEASSPRMPITGTAVAGTTSNRIQRVADTTDKINSEAGKYLREYRASVARREAEIYERLRYLDALIDEPRSTSALDAPVARSYRESRPDLREVFAEYDSYRAELSSLASGLKSATVDAMKSQGLQGAAVCPPVTAINGTVGSGSPDFPATSGLQTGRLLNGLGNINCGSSNPCTLNTTEGLRAFDAYTFTNTGSDTACVTVTFDMTGCSLGQAMQFSARVGTFDPANPCANYVGDGGAGFSGEFDGSFSFNVPAGQDFVVVVNENDPAGAVGCAYKLTISGLSCQAVCPPATPINGVIGSGSKDLPAAIGQQTGRLLNGLGNFSCGSSNPCSLNTTSGLRTFDAYTFINPGSSTACVTVAFEMTGCSLGQAMQFSARLGSFDPDNPCANYLGDGGAGFSGEADGDFSFNVPAGQNFVVVVNENDPGGAVGCAYSLTISGIDCPTIPPPPCTITCPSNITQVNDPDQCGAVVNFPAPTVTGDCGTVSCSPQAGSFFPVGTTTVTCSTTSGPSCSFTVTVNDAQPPTITCPANVTAVAPATCNGSSGAVVNFSSPTASDACAGVTSSCSPPSGSGFPVGTTTVVCTATDAGGNTASCSFSVTVFGGCLQDDSNAANVVLFNTTTGEYRFCCNGSVVATGVGSVTKKGCEVTIVHNTSTRRVLIKQNVSVGRGSASIQGTIGNLLCTITDRNILDNACQCGG